MLHSRPGLLAASAQVLPAAFAFYAKVLRVHLCVRLMFRPEIDRQSPCGRLPARRLAAAPAVGKAGALTARRSAPLQTRAPACWPRLDWHAFQAKTGNLVLAHQHLCMRVCAMLALFYASPQSGPSAGWLVSSKQGLPPE